MALSAVVSPYQPINGLTGLGLNAGSLYIGVDGQDPETDPQQCYWDSAGTVPASQPIQIMGGYPMRLGTPTRLYTGATYSIRVRDATGAQVFYEASAVAAANTAGVYNTRADAAAAVVPASQHVTGIQTLGFYTVGDLGRARYKYATAQAAGAGKFQSADGAWWELAEPSLYIEMFGVVGDGVTVNSATFTEVTTYINATGAIVRLQPKTYLCGVPLTLLTGGFVGEASGYNKSISSTIKFTGIGGSAGITTDGDNFKSPVRLEQLTLDFASWTGGTACTGYGIDASGPILAENLWVFRACKSGLFLHVTATSHAPYGSTFRDCRFYYNGQHGVMVGTGASVTTFINCDAKWNGAPAYDTAPSAAGSYSGMRLDYQGDGNPGGAYASLLIESVNILGGDYSYNSAYGVDAQQVSAGRLAPGYAEGNLAQGPGGLRQMRLGTDFNATFDGETIANGKSGVFRDNIYLGGNITYTVRVTVNGQEIGPSDDAGGRSQIYQFQNLRSRYLNDGSGNVVDAYGDVTNGSWNVALFGSALLVLGAGSTYTLQISPNKVQLPARYYYGAWRNDQGTAAPTSGAYNQGDKVWNSNPAAGAYLGWVCVVAGSPGTWKGFGLIQA